MVYKWLFIKMLEGTALALMFLALVIVCLAFLPFALFITALEVSRPAIIRIADFFGQSIKK